MEDSLGICDELEADMARHVEAYQCDWKATLASPERRERFRAFVNSEQPDPNIVFITERGQPRPATPEEKPVPSVLGAPTLEA
jgi:nitrite reductase (NADH) large subunit